MRKNQAIIIQLIVWISLWSFFMFSAGDRMKSTHFQLSIGFRILGFAILYNVFFYYLLPMLLKGKKPKFYSLSLAVFFIYFSTSIAFDAYLRSLDEEWKKRKIPLLYIIMPPLSMGIAVIGTAASVRGISEFEKKKIAEEEANRKRLEAEIQLLKSQINPHFMLNSLNNIYALSLSDRDKTSDAILKLSQLVSYILYECPKKMVPLQQEIAFIKTYISMQQLRMPDNMHLVVQLPDKVNDALMIEPMILISFIENAFKHGVTTKDEADIVIDIKEKDKAVSMEIHNKVYTQNKTFPVNNEGIGIANSRQRLDHSYTERYLLSAGESNGIYHVKLTINLES